MVINDQIHYPVLGVGVEIPVDTEQLNWRFRHEFRHILREKSTERQ